jgi:transposase
VHFQAVLQQISIPAKRGRPRTRAKEIVADKSYDAAYIRKMLRQRGIQAMIPEKRLRPGTKRRKKGPGRGGSLPL